MKNLWKIMAAMLVIALPFVVAACGDDDEEPQPVTYTYRWTLENVDLPSGSTVEQRQAALNAQSAINVLIVQEFTTRKFTVDATSQKLTVTTMDNVADWDDKVKRAVSTLKGMDALAEAAEALPNDAKIVVKRDNAKNAIVDEKLR